MTDQKRALPHRTVFSGVFVDLPPTSTPWQEAAEPCQLRIRCGVLWVSAVDGTIEGHDWTVKTEADLSKFLAEKKWVESTEGIGAAEEVRVIRSNPRRNGFFFPGFVDTHIHASQYPNCGLFGKSSLLDWLENYTFPLESSFGPRPHSSNDVNDDPESPTDSPETIAQRVRSIYGRVVQRTLSHGTTCASYFATIHVAATNILADICFRRGQRALIGRVCMDDKNICPHYYKDESAEAGTAATVQSIEYIQSLDPSGTLIRPVVTPRFAPSCTPASLTMLADIANSAQPPLMIQTHLSENKDEVGLVKAMFPNSESYTHVYDGHGLLTPRTVLAHAIHISPSEQALIRDRGTGLSHCPASNSAIGSGLCRVRSLLDNGVAVGLGTDVSAGYSPNILEAVRQTCLVSRLVGFSADSIDENKAAAQSTAGRDKLSIEEALYLATRGGARLVNLDGPGGIGGFDIGRSFDAQKIELGPNVGEPDWITVNGECIESSLNYWSIDLFGHESWEEKIEKWVWRGDDRNVQCVWVGGRTVHAKPY